MVLIWCSRWKILCPTNWMLLTVTGSVEKSDNNLLFCRYHGLCYKSTQSQRSEPVNSTVWSRSRRVCERTDFQSIDIRDRMYTYLKTDYTVVNLYTVIRYSVFSILEDYSKRRLSAYLETSVTDTNSYSLWLPWTAKIFFTVHLWPWQYFVIPSQRCKWE